MKSAPIALNKDWQKYSGYGMSGEAKAGAREALHAGSFVLAIDALDEPLVNDASLRAALALLGLCGGIGAKSRNGWGSLTLSELASDRPLARPWRYPTDRAALDEALREAILSPVPRAQYTATSLDSAFTIGPEADTAAAAHEWLIVKYKRFVTGFDFPRSPIVAPPLQGVQGEYRAQFGLPRRNKRMPLERAGKRQAKPLFLHVHRASEREFFPVVVAMPGAFLEPSRPLPNDGDDLAAFVEYARSSDR